MENLHLDSKLMNTAPNTIPMSKDFVPDIISVLLYCDMFLTPGLVFGFQKVRRKSNVSPCTTAKILSLPSHHYQVLNWVYTYENSIFPNVLLYCECTPIFSNVTVTSPKRYVEGLTYRTSKCDLIWAWGHCRHN